MLLYILDSHARTQTKTVKFEEVEQGTGKFRIHFKYASGSYNF